MRHEPLGPRPERITRGRAYPPLHQVQAADDDDLEMIARDFPIAMADPRSLPSRDAAEAAIRETMSISDIREALLSPLEVETPTEQQSSSRRDSRDSRDLHIFSGAATVAAPAGGLRRASSPPATDRTNDDHDSARAVGADGQPGSGDDHSPGSPTQSHGQLGTDFMRNVPLVPGIPQNCVKAGSTKFSLLGLLVLLAVTCSAVLNWWRHAVYVEEVPLRQKADVTLNLKNCGVSFVEFDGPESYIRVKSWMHYRISSQADVPVIRKGPEGQVHVLLHMSNFDPWYKCAAEFHLAKGFAFGALNLIFAPADRYVRVESHVPIRGDSIAVDAFHAYVRLSSVEAKSARFILGAGHLYIELDGPAAAYSNTPISIVSRTAEVHLVSLYPLSLSMGADTAAASLFRATGNVNVSVSEDGKGGGYAKALLHPADVSSLFAGLMSIKVDIEAEQSAVYATSRGAKEDAEWPMHTWAGREQQKKPHMDPYSLLRVQSALQWLQEDPAAPWIILVDQAGVSHPGSWRILSSNAYLRSVYWFVVLSGGMLQPRILHLPVQTRGLFCRGHIDEEDDTLPDIVTSSEESLLQSLANFFTPTEKAKPLSKRQSLFLAKAVSDDIEEGSAPLEEREYHGQQHSRPGTGASKGFLEGLASAAAVGGAALAGPAAAYPGASGPSTHQATRVGNSRFMLSDLTSASWARRNYGF